MRNRAVRNPEQQARTREKDALLRLASCTQTPPQKLIEIAEIAQTRSYGVVLRTLARNVSCPPEALGILVTIDPFAVAKNPVLPLVLLEDPDFLNRSGETAVLRMLMRKNLPASLLEFVQYHRSTHVQQAVRTHVCFEKENKHREESDISKVTDKVNKVTDKVNTEARAWIQSFLIGDEVRLHETRALRLIVGNESWFSPTTGFPDFVDVEAGREAEHVSTPRKQLSFLAQHAEASVRFAALRSADRLGYDLRPILAEHYKTSSPPSTPPATQAEIAWNLTRFAPLSRLASSVYPLERLCAALNPRLERELRERLKDDANRLVRAHAPLRLP